MSDKQLELGQDESFIALQRAWGRVLEVLSKSVIAPSFASWVKPATPLGINGGVVRLGTPSGFATRYLRDNLSHTIIEVLEAELGFPVTLDIKHTTDKASPILEIAQSAPKATKRDKADEESISLPLNSKYVFETFVIGRANRLANACAMCVAEEPGKKYNPLFLYGGSGLGKTHLLHAIGNCAKQVHPNMTVVYLSGEAFTFQYVNSVREHKTADFRRRFRNVDLWLVDDIQFIAGKERTEEEFFHTFNALYEGNKQVVLSSDQSPKELELDARLLSRFECGMLADIKVPDLETRMAIIQNKAATEGMELPNDIVLYIAQLITSNIRQIEGALIKLHANSSLMHAPITLSLAEDVLGDYYNHNSIKILDVGKIQQTVATRFSIEISELLGSNRSANISLPRQIAMYLIRELIGSSLPAIGKAFGNRDHSTVFHACKQVEKRMASDPAFASTVQELDAELK